MDEVAVKNYEPERHLLACCIEHGVRDATGRNGSKFIVGGWSYFGGDEYQRHLAWLGFPPEWLPLEIEKMPDEEIDRLSEVVLR